MQRLVDPAVMIVTMVIPTLDSQKLKKAGHRFSFLGFDLCAPASDGSGTRPDPAGHRSMLASRFCNEIDIVQPRIAQQPEMPEWRQRPPFQQANGRPRGPVLVTCPGELG